MHVKIRNIFFLLACVEMVEIAVGIIFGVTTSQISLLFFLHYIKSCGGWGNLVESGKKGGAQEFKIKVSSGDLLSF